MIKYYCDMCGAEVNNIGDFWELHLSPNAMGKLSIRKNVCEKCVDKVKLVVLK